MQAAVETATAGWAACRTVLAAAAVAVEAVLLAAVDTTAGGLQDSVGAAAAAAAAVAVETVLLAAVDTTAGKCRVHGGCRAQGGQ